MLQLGAYLIYGMYYCFNIVTERKDYPAAVLIRAIQPVSRKAIKLYSRKAVDGPGKVCQYMRIDKRLNGIDLTGSKLWVEDRGFKIKKSTIHCSKRIGVDYAGFYKDKKWRFFIKIKGKDLASLPLCNHTFPPDSNFYLFLKHPATCFAKPGHKTHFCFSQIVGCFSKVPRTSFMNSSPLSR